MTCETCGAAVGIVDSTDYGGSDRFQEEYECARGHKGFITGNGNQNPNEWNRFGGVFE